MNKKAYRYRFVEKEGERPATRQDRRIHSELITLYDTDRDTLEKVAIIHNEHHFGGTVNGLDDPYPYDVEECPCRGGKPPVKVWNGKEVFLVPFEEWAGDPEVPVLVLDRERNEDSGPAVHVLDRIGRLFRALCRKAGLM